MLAGAILAPTDVDELCVRLMRIGGPLWSPAVLPRSRLRGQAEIG
jgi:hypothetical protein